MVHYACVKSAVERIRPEQAFLYFEQLPSGPLWDLTTEIVKCEKITAPRAVFGNPLLHYAHRADVVRLEKLIEMGGIYLDCDVFVHRDFEDLLDNFVVLGQEGEDGLCNAVIMAEPGAPFLRRWYSGYKSFRSKGRDRFWSEHSVQLPLKLARFHREELTILGPKAFFWPSWDPQGIKRIFASTEPIRLDGVYANHLWESCAWDAYLRDLTPARVRTVDSNFHSWLRPMIVDLPDNLGARPIARRIGSGIVTRLENNRLPAIARSTYRRSKQKVGRVLPIVRYRHRAIDKVVAVMAALTAKGLRADFLADTHRRRIFQSIYRDHLWGTDGASAFFSGVGSRGQHAKAYVETMAPVIERRASASADALVIVDLGCGDFTVGSALLQSLGNVRYIGCDIVPELVDHNQYKFGTERVEFRRVDITRDSLPDGDVCLVRQVLQHLSNAEITAILPSLAKYEHVYVSEGQPLTLEGPPNPDKPTGANVRFDWRSGRGRGVELHLPPWNLPLEEIMRTASVGHVNEIIVTHRVLSIVPYR